MDRIETIRQIPEKDRSPLMHKLLNTELIGGTAYSNLHPQFLTPLNIDIDIAKFRDEMNAYTFHIWGSNRPELITRTGLSLVNLDGKLSSDDISNGPVDMHNKDHPNDVYIESDFLQHTAALDTSEALTPLLCFDLCRTSILKWQIGDDFLPHIDVRLPAVNLRLWGTDAPENVSLKYKEGDNMIECENVEAGKLYIIDTSIIHSANATNGQVYQFFIGLLPSAKNIKLLKSLTGF